MPRSSRNATSSPFPHREREQLLHFLAEAAELEHNLLCCYLYAAFSLKRGIDEGLTREELAAVGRWRKVILSVAHEEMAHLVVVNNLIVALGGTAHFNRPNFSAHAVSDALAFDGGGPAPAQRKLESCDGCRAHRLRV